MELTPAVPWNSMELGVHQFRWHEQFHGIPWNLECANFADRSSSMEFHGNPWNLEYANFNDINSSMEFHGTRDAPISLTREVPWNSMDLKVCQFRWHEKFHGFLWNSMELAVRQFRWQQQFHGIPWNFGCANFDDSSSSMEFHGT